MHMHACMHAIFALVVPVQQSTYGLEHAMRLLQSPRDVLHGAEHQRGDHHVHGLVLDGAHVLPGGDHKPLVGQVAVLAHAPLQVLLEVVIGVRADDLAAGRVVLKIGAGAAADLQDGERAVAGSLEVGHVAEQVPLSVVHRLVVRSRDPGHEQREEALVPPYRPSASISCSGSVSTDTHKVRSLMMGFMAKS